MQDPLDVMPLDSGSLPPVLDPGGQLAPFTTLQLPLEPPSRTHLPFPQAGTRVGFPTHYIPSSLQLYCSILGAASCMRTHCLDDFNE